MDENEQEFWGVLSQVYLAAARRMRAARVIFEQGYVVPYPPPCTCYLIGGIFQRQHRSRMLSRYWYSLRREFSEEQILVAAELGGWDTLRGRGGRRELLEEMFPVEAQSGRPREVFLTERDRKVTARFLDHARKKGRRHVEEAYREQTVVTIRLNDDASHVDELAPVPLLSVPGARDAIAVVDTAGDLTDGRYEYRRDSLTADFLSHLTGLSSETLRKPLAEDRDDFSDWLDPAGELLSEERFHSLLGIQVGEIDLEAKLDTPEGAADPEAIKERLGDKELAEMAERMGLSVEELMERVARA